MTKKTGNQQAPNQPAVPASGYKAEFRFIVTKPDGGKVIVAASSADEAIAKVQGL